MGEADVFQDLGRKMILTRSEFDEPKEETIRQLRHTLTRYQRFVAQLYIGFVEDTYEPWLDERYADIIDLAKTTQELDQLQKQKAACEEQLKEAGERRKELRKQIEQVVEKHAEARAHQAVLTTPGDLSS